ncbi:MAG: Histidinol-phosphate aminotransferase [Paracidovorax wautersii]|uniref:Histidinol-phosphate aminotransferase n=1 Tax=Paracidovorax wautersii TaxID=1177982 RepID=A0A7V8FQE4_9BURK|nr:MAG: Histidinol-phosphate aminotransferase [Paracidovorax wautersii]
MALPLNGFIRQFFEVTVPTSSSFWSPIVGELDPYVPGEQPKIANLVKLNTNENPYPPSPKAVQAIRDAAQARLELYPDPDASIVREAVARYHGIAPSQVFVGNGSDEVLAHAFFAFFQQLGQRLLMPDITYSFYKVYCGLYDIAYDVVPLQDDMQLDVEAFATPERVAQAGGIIVANPNAPTGIELPLAAIERLLQAHPQRVVLVDEAYVDFGGESAIGLVQRYPNLLVVHTLSKSRALAGLRVGFAVGQAHLIDALERVKNSFNSYPIDRLAAAGAAAAYEDVAYFEQRRQEVIASREQLASQLRTLGFDVLPSKTNFVFARHPGHDAAALQAALRAEGVLVRHFKLPRIAQYLRITIGTPAQCERLLAVLRQTLNAA